MTNRPELLDATDDVIDDAVNHADPLVLRGLLYQLTGDEDLVDVEISTVSTGFMDANAMTDAGDIARVRAKAAAFLKRHRDAGAPEIGPGPAERLHKSMSLTVGAPIPHDELDLWLEQLALDPWNRGIEWQEQPTEEQLRDFSVAVIGAGMGGLNAAVQLQRSGIPYFVIEKNADVGGTWYENQYPGARVDSPSRTYTHVYGANYRFPYAFSPQRYNLQYFNWVADNFDVRKDIIFNTEVRSIVWDESAKLWEITADGSEGRRSWRVNAVITSIGFLSRPNMPQLEGMETFAGQAFHTARWPKNLDLSGKRVAVIGSGATGYQLVPELAKVAGNVEVFQRAPSWCFDVPGYLSPFPEQVNWLDRNFPYLSNFIRLNLSWMGGPEAMQAALRIDPDFRDPHTRSARNRRARDERVAYISKKLASRPELIEKMIPGAPPLSSRWVLVDTDYNIYDALVRDNVALISDPIQRITPTGIVTEKGDHPVDIIVYATGFKANDFLWPMDVRGIDGQGIEDLWSRDGARAYVGTMLPGFPNFFMIYGPNTNNFGGLQIVDLEEMATRFALNCIGGLITSRKTTVDVSDEAYWRFNDELDRCESRMMYSDSRVTTYYKNDHGRSAANCPIDVRRMWRWLRDPVSDTERPMPAADRGVKPRFGEDLIVE